MLLGVPDGLSAALGAFPLSFLRSRSSLIFLVSSKKNQKKRSCPALDLCWGASLSLSFFFLLASLVEKQWLESPSRSGANGSGWHLLSCLSMHCAQRGALHMASWCFRFVVLLDPLIVECSNVVLKRFVKGYFDRLQNRRHPA